MEHLAGALAEEGDEEEEGEEVQLETDPRQVELEVTLEIPIMSARIGFTHKEPLAILQLHGASLSAVTREHDTTVTVSTTNILVRDLMVTDRRFSLMVSTLQPGKSQEVDKPPISITATRTHKESPSYKGFHLDIAADFEHLRMEWNPGTMRAFTRFFSQERKNQEPAQISLPATGNEDRQGGEQASVVQAPEQEPTVSKYSLRVGLFAINFNREDEGRHGIG